MEASLILTVVVCAVCLGYGAALFWSCRDFFFGFVPPQVRAAVAAMWSLGIGCLVYVIYGVAFLVTALARFVVGRITIAARRFVFRLFGAVDCCACRKRLRKPYLWLKKDRIPNTETWIERISHTYCRECFDRVTEDFRAATAVRSDARKRISQPTAGGRELRVAGNPVASIRSIAGRGMRASTGIEANPRPALRAP